MGRVLLAPFFLKELSYRYVAEFADCHIIYNANTIDQMGGVDAGMIGKWIMRP